VAPETLSDLWEGALRLTIELVNRPPIPACKIQGHPGKQEPDPPHNPPYGAGVYLFRKGQNVMIYVGQTKTLRKRVLSDYLGYRRNDTVSGRDFKVKVANHCGLSIGDASNWLKENCSVSWVEIPDSEMRTRVEKLLIAWASVEKQPLLNRVGRRWRRSLPLVEAVKRLTSTYSTNTIRQ
jgi:hypothetical protein